jgi:hypothetical protein
VALSACCEVERAWHLLHEHKACKNMRREHEW